MNDFVCCLICDGLPVKPPIDQAYTIMSLNWKPSLWTANWMTTSIALASFWGNGTPWKSRRKKKKKKVHRFLDKTHTKQVQFHVFSVHHISCVLLWQGQREEQMAWCSLTVLPPNPGWFQPNTEYPPINTTEETVSHPSSAWMLKIQQTHWGKHIYRPVAYSCSRPHRILRFPHSRSPVIIISALESGLR